MKRFVIQVTPNHSEAVTASSSTQAKYKVWNRIKDSYTYGYRNRSQFVKGTKVR